jgi:hypothetical protein
MKRKTGKWREPIAVLEDLDGGDSREPVEVFEDWQEEQSGGAAGETDLRDGCSKADFHEGGSNATST